jgi:hemerythrin-like domain-containing protein
VSLLADVAALILRRARSVVKDEDDGHDSVSARDRLAFSARRPMRPVALPLLTNAKRRWERFLHRAQARRQETGHMDAIQFLKQEHEKAKRAFGEILEASGDQRGQLWKKLLPELKAHEQVEEAGLYGPIARDTSSAKDELRDWEQHHREEVGEFESLVQEINGLDPAGDEWMEKIEDAEEMLEQHIEEEEGTVWPQIQQVWDRSKLEQAGSQMETMHKQKLRQAA